MKKILTCALFAFLCLFSISCLFHRKHTIQGYVYEAFNKSPVSGIEVKADTQVVLTNKDGFYQISGIRLSKVPVVVGDHKRFEDLIDTLILDSGQNFRDFILNAKHPLNIDFKEYMEPSSYHCQITVGVNEKIPQFFAKADMVPIDESMKITGMYFDDKKQIKPFEMVQIGITYWEKDSYNNWNETIKPDGKVTQYPSLLRDMLKKCYHFFEDPQLKYSLDPKEFTIEGQKTSLFYIQGIGTENSSIHYEVYVIKEGANVGQIKKIIRRVGTDSNTMLAVILNRWNEDIKIEPPLITQ